MPAQSDETELAPVEIPPAHDAIVPGSMVDRYVVRSCLGRGAMGVVYAAYDPELDRRVALKVLRHEGVSWTTHRLLREARAMARLAHANVVTVFDVGRIGERVFIAMELVEGQTLTQWLEAGRRTLDGIVAVFIAGGRGLAAAHAAGLVHRDFKPDNVLVGGGRVCVTDFGLARAAVPDAVEARPGVQSSAAPDWDQSGWRSAFVGTPAYMSPEQYRGLPADARADQFSFAVALYDALYGERPFTATSAAAYAQLVIEGRVRPPPTGSTVPIALRRVLLRALAAAPEARFRSMNELLDALARASEPCHRRPRTLAAALVAGLIVIGVTGYAAQQHRESAALVDWEGELRGVVAETQASLRTAHMLPAHDIRLDHERVHARMASVEAKLQTSIGREAAGLGSYLLGAGSLALGDAPGALALLETAYRAGVRGAQIDEALGRALGIVYERGVHAAERDPARRETLQRLETRYRDPALTHLRAALAAAPTPPGYLEALVLFHQHRFAEAAERAHAAFVESPTLYEAGLLEARARGEIAIAAQRAGEDSVGTQQRFADACQANDRVLQIARSDDAVWLLQAGLRFAQARNLARDGELSADQRAAIEYALRMALQINPENAAASAAQTALRACRVCSPDMFDAD